MEFSGRDCLEWLVFMLDARVRCRDMFFGIDYMIIGILCAQIDFGEHYVDVIMGTVASQITSLTIVYSNVYSTVDQRKHQSSASLAFVREFTVDQCIPRTRCQ